SGKRHTLTRGSALRCARSATEFTSREVTRPWARAPRPCRSTAPPSQRPRLSLRPMSASTGDDLAATARQAIGLVCSGNLDRVADFYDERFVDHVNAMVFHGHAGARESVGFYRQLFSDLRFD